jgi:hypothetical protein
MERNGVFGWTLADLENENLVKLQKIPSSFERLNDWKVFLPYIIEDFRASLSQAIPKKENSPHRITFKNDTILFKDNIKVEKIESFRNSVCLLGNGKGRHILAVLRFPLMEPDKINYSFPITFSVSIAEDASNFEFDTLTFLLSFTPVERSYNTLYKLSIDNCPNFMSDLLTGKLFLFLKLNLRTLFSLSPYFITYS